MKDSRLIIGIGAGLLLGAAAIWYFSKDEEERQRMIEDVEKSIRKAKKNIRHQFEDSIEDLKDKAEELGRIAEDKVKDIKSNL
jgi:ribosome recycling factor